MSHPSLGGAGAGVTGAGAGAEARARAGAGAGAGASGPDLAGGAEGGADSTTQRDVGHGHRGIT